MAVKFSNNATSTLAASINTTVTSISIQSADAAKFPTLSAGDWFPITLVDSAGNTEIMRCTARTGATLTVTRAQEGTTAKSFVAGSRVDLRLTAAAINEVYSVAFDASNLNTGTVPNARITGAYDGITTLGQTGLHTITTEGEAIRLVGSATGDPYFTFYKGTVRQAYIQHVDGTGANQGLVLLNDVATGGDTRLTLLNSGGVGGLEYTVNGTEYTVYHTGNLSISTGAGGNTLAQRDSSGDVHARLFRSEYDTTNAAVNFIMTQINTGTDNYIRPSTPAQVAAALGPILTADKVETNVSGEFTPTAGGLITWAHGLGAKPSMIDAYMICKTADNGWAVNEEIGPLSNIVTYADRWVGYVIWADATNVYCRVQNASSGNYVFPAIVTKSTGAPVYATAASWRLKFKVRK